VEAAPQLVRYDLAEMMFSPTAALFEGKARAGIDISIFVVRTPPGRFIEMHVHPYSETFVLLEGHGRWTVGEEVAELAPDQLLVVPAHTPHGLRNTGDVPLLVVSVHEPGTLEQRFLGVEPA
jgi:mannose-6-phosphate isomerase-like protein (cupin superfamily)